jgi:hypothetical protein
LREYPHEYAYHWFLNPAPLEKNSGIGLIRSGCNRTKSNFMIGPRNITYYSLHFVLKGEEIIFQGGKEKKIKEGDLFCLFQMRHINILRIQLTH